MSDDFHLEWPAFEFITEVFGLAPQVQLLALDHPADTEVFTNEKSKGPPSPESSSISGRMRRVRIGQF